MTDFKTATQSTRDQAKEWAGESVTRNIDIMAGVIDKSDAKSYTPQDWVNDMSALWVGALRDTARVYAVWAELATKLADPDGNLQSGGGP